MPLSPVYLNNSWLPLEQAKISPLDRGFLFADGVYEVIPVYHKVPFYLDLHLVRLFNNLQTLKIDGIQQDHLETILKQLAQQTTSPLSYIYCQITRGADPLRNHVINKSTRPTLFAYAENTTPSTNLQKGIQVHLMEDCRWKRNDIKSISLLGTIFARMQANEQGFEDLIFHQDGFIIEGSASNIFVAKDGNIRTPNLSPQLLAGISRKIIIDLLQQQQIPCQQSPISIIELLDADAVWITSSTRELVPITKIDDTPIPTLSDNSPYHQTHHLWHQHTAEYVKNNAIQTTQ